MPPTTHPKLPQEPRFYQRTLDYLPTAVLVVRGDGTIMYGNQAMIALTGWGIEDGIDMQMLDVVHPDDRAWVIEAFASVAASPIADHALEAPSWSPVRFRVISKDGTVVPIEVIGGGGLHDPTVEGIIYTVRSCRDDELLAQVFKGVASNRPIESAAVPLVERLLLPPVRMYAALFEQRANGSARCIAANHDVLRDLPASCEVAVPWAGLVTEPSKINVDELPPVVAEPLRAAGFKSCFHAGAHAPDHETTLRLVACSALEHVSAEGPLTQIRLARELLLVVAAKAYNDRVIANNANRDDLTGLPNRLGLLHHFERLKDTSDDCGIMFVDIDNFKQINDEYGHPAGDRVLSAVADRLIRTVRPDDFVSRIGGDEFAIVLSDSYGRLGHETFESLAERVVGILNESVTYDGVPIPLTASVGVAKAGPNRDLDDLMSRADGAMYRAKRAGGGQHHLDLTFAA